MRALLIAIACLLMGDSVAAAQTAAPAKRTVQLSRMGSSLEDGGLDTRFQFGLACATDSSVRLRNINSRFDDADFRRAFREAMVNSGIPMPSEGNRDLFSGPGGSGDLQVGAMIRSLRLQTCTRTRVSGSNTEGSARIEVEWQVYSSEEGKVVTRIATYGSYSTEDSAERIVERLLIGAFKRAAQDFADDPTFLRVVKTGDVKREVTTPLTPLSIVVPEPRQTPIARAGSAVVSIVVADGHGSGVLVSPDGYILTNRHVAGDSGKVRIVWANGSESSGQVLRANRKRDVALVKVDDPKAEPLSIRHEPAQLGETVFAIGTPLEKDLAGTLTRGIVSGLRLTDGQPFIQSDVVINHGNSGGPLLDEKGQVIGLTVAGFESGGAMMGINFFIPIDDALKVLVVAARTPVAAAPPPRPAGRPPARPTGKVTSRK
jgi:S1-C subfamily serine protease